MRIVVALGGNALLRRGQPMTAEHQRENVRVAAEQLAPDRRGQRARHLARQRPAGRAARAPGGGVRGGRGLPARRPRRPDRGHDRLHDRAGAGQPPPVRAAVREHPDDGRGRPGRPGVQRPDQVHRPGLRAEEAERARRREGLGDQAGRRQVAARRRVADAASGSSRSGRSAGCSSAAPSSSAPAAAGSRRCTSRARGRSSAPRSSIDKDRASALLAERARGGPVRHGHRRRRGLHATGARRSRRRSGSRRRRRSPRCRCRRARWAPRWRPPPRSCSGPASGPRSARWPSWAASSPGSRGRGSSQIRRQPRRADGDGRGRGAS